MDLEWDQQKAAANLRKHGIDFADALGRVVVVAFVWRGTRIRLISARRAAYRERSRYEERR